MLLAFTFQAALCAVVLPEATSNVVTIDKRECDYVVFHLDYPQPEQPFQVSWQKVNTTLGHWTQDNIRHGQHVHVFPNGTLELRVVRKEDEGLYVAKVCNRHQQCSYQRKVQLYVHGHLVRGHVGDCVTFDLNCLQLHRYIHVQWKKDKQRVAQIKQVENVLKSYCNRIHVFPNGSLSLCPTQWGDEGVYVADVFGQDGKYLHQETVNLELSVETFKEIREVIGGSMFLKLPETKLKHFFRVVWKKESTEIAWTNGSWLWYHEEYVNRSEIVFNYSLRIDRVQEYDRGRYSIEVSDRDGRTVYKTIANVIVEQNETFRRNAICLLLSIPLVSLGVLIMTALVVLICHFKKLGDRPVLDVQRANVILTETRYSPEEYEEVGEISSCSQKEEILSMQELHTSNSTKERNEGSQRSDQEANPATADKVEKEPSCEGSKE